MQKKKQRKKKKATRRDQGKREEKSNSNEGTRSVECISQYSSHTEGVFIAGPKVLDARGTFEPLAETRWRRVGQKREKRDQGIGRESARSVLPCNLLTAGLRLSISWHNSGMDPDGP